MKKFITAVLLGAFCMLCLVGCGKEKEAVLYGEEAETEADKAEAEAQPGEVLDTEQISMVTEDGEELRDFVRVQGDCGYSLAYDPKIFTFQNEDDADTLLPVGEDGQEIPEVSICIAENPDYALEELTDILILNCDYECMQEDTFIGEEEYPAVWIMYTEERGGRLCQTEYYLVGFENRVIQIQTECTEDALPQFEEEIQMVLSTLRFGELAEG